MTTSEPHPLPSPPGVTQAFSSAFVALLCLLMFGFVTVIAGVWRLFQLLRRGWPLKPGHGGSFDGGTGYAFRRRPGE